jgi:hypothetical protein
MSDSHSKQDQGINFKSVDEQIAALQIKKSLDLQKGLSSNDPYEILKAQSYLEGIRKTKTDPKAYFFPMDYSYQTGKPYKEINNNVPDHILRRVSYIHIVDLIIQTKINQVSEYLKFSDDEQKEGFTIRKKLSRFEDRSKKKRTKDEEKEIERLVDFFENGGYNEKWDLSDDLLTFTSKILRDSFTFNRCTFELERNMMNELIRPVPVDAQTIRLLETIDPYYEIKHPQARYSKKKFGDSKKEYLPRFCQIWDGQICLKPGTNEQIVWYPWELAYETRRKSTDIWRNGYPIGEIEVLTNIITWILNGLTYNGNFFSQGSNPKGILNLKQEGGGQEIMNQLRQMWTQSISGVHNAHKMPVVEGMDMEFIDLRGGTNKDMEFQMWNEFLIVLTCAVFQIDPSELGFHFKTQSDSFGTKGEQQRLDHSKDKGLKPILVFLQKLFNKYLTSELNDEYEFVFTGVDIEDETNYIENDVKKSQNGWVSMEDMFEKYSNRKFNPKKDTILNQVYQSAQQAQQFGNPEMNEMVDEETGEPDEGVQNPFDEFSKSQESSPIWSETTNWLKEKGFIDERTRL